MVDVLNYIYHNIQYIRKYGMLVNDFTEEFEGVLHARNQSDHYQSGFVISLLKGTALEELVTFFECFR